MTYVPAETVANRRHRAAMSHGRHPEWPAAVTAPGDGAAGPCRRDVVVLDHNEWRRRGLADGVRELGSVPAVHSPAPGTLGHAPWRGVRLALVCIDMPATAWDRYGGLRLVQAARDLTDAEAVTVALTTSCDNPLVAVRAGEAGADYLYPAEEVDDLERLGQVVTAPDADRTPQRMADPLALRLLGLSFASRLTAGLDMVEALGLAPAFDGHSGHGLSRRRAITTRRRLAETIGVRPVGPVSATARQHRFPSWQQLRDLLNLARGAAP